MADDGAHSKEQAPSVRKRALRLGRLLELEAARARFRNTDEGIECARACFEELCEATEKLVSELHSELPLEYVRRDRETLAVILPPCSMTVSLGAPCAPPECIEPRAATVTAWRTVSPGEALHDAAAELARFALVSDVLSAGGLIGWYYPFGSKPDFWQAGKTSELLLHWFMDLVEARLTELSTEYLTRSARESL